MLRSTPAPPKIRIATVYLILHFGVDLSFFGRPHRHGNRHRRIPTPPGTIPAQRGGEGRVIVDGVTCEAY